MSNSILLLAYILFGTIKLVKDINTKEYFIIVSLLLVLAAFVVSLDRYFFKKDFNIIVATECDPEEENCFSDEEYFYHKFSVHAKTLEDFCSKEHDDECIMGMFDQGLAEKIECNEDTIEDWEFCTDI